MNDESNETGFHISSDPDKTEITQPGRAEAHASVQLPFRLLLVSDLTPHDRSPNWSKSSRIHSVDKHSFSGLMQELAPELTLEVPNRISETPKMLDIDLRFSDLEAFSLEHLVRSIAPMNRLYEVRTLVAQAGDGKIDRETFRERIEEIGIERNWAEHLYEALKKPGKPRGETGRRGTSSPAQRSDEDTVDRILGMIQTDDEVQNDQSGSTQAESPVSSIMDALVAGIAGDSKRGEKVDTTASKQLLDELDAVLSEQLDLVINHPQVRRLEAAWRGLKFMVDRINFRKNISLDVLAAGRHELEEAIHYQVLMPEHRGTQTKPPLSAVIVDLALGPRHRDVELMRDLAHTGASLQVPIIASADPSFFAAEKPEELAQIPVLTELFKRDVYAEWNSLRDEEETRFLTLALPSVLLRYPYGNGASSDGLACEESGYLWGSASPVVGVMAAQSFAETGWPTRLAGHPVEDLPVRSTNAGAMPVSALFPEETQEALADAGFSVLAGHLNRDFVYIEHAQTTHRPKTYDEPEATAEARIHASLPCQLFVSRAAQYLMHLQDDLGSGDDLEQIKADVQARLEAFLRTGEEPLPEGTIEVERVEQRESTAHHLLAVRLRPPRSILDRPVSLVMGLQVPKAP